MQASWPGPGPPIFCPRYEQWVSGGQPGHSAQHPPGPSEQIGREGWRKDGERKRKKERAGGREGRWRAKEICREKVRERDRNGEKIKRE